MNEAQRVIEKCKVMATPDSQMNWEDIENLYTQMVELFSSSSQFIYDVLTREEYQTDLANDKRVLYAVNQIGKDVKDFQTELESLRNAHLENGKTNGFVDSEQYPIYLQVGQGYNSWFAKFNGIILPNVTIVQEFVAKHSLKVKESEKQEQENIEHKE